MEDSLNIGSEAEATVVKPIDKVWETIIAEWESNKKKAEDAGLTIQAIRWNGLIERANEMKHAVFVTIKDSPKYKEVIAEYKETNNEMMMFQNLLDLVRIALVLA